MKSLFNKKSGENNAPKYSYLAVAGSRAITDYDYVKRTLDVMTKVGDGPTFNWCIVSGGAGGVDTLAKAYAEREGYHYVEVPAMWNTHGKAAGFVRNAIMVDLADAVIAIWDGESRGTKSTIDLGIKSKKPVIVINAKIGEAESYNL